MMKKITKEEKARFHDLVNVFISEAKTREDREERKKFIREIEKSLNDNTFANILVRVITWAGKKM